MAEAPQNLADLHRRLDAVRHELTGEVSLAYLLEVNGVLLLWLELHGLVEEAMREKSMKVVEPFWSLCARYNIPLLDRDKEQLFNDLFT